MITKYVKKNKSSLGVLKIVFFNKNFAHSPGTIKPEKNGKNSKIDFWGLCSGLNFLKWIRNI